jgi:hypothetical protein
MAVKIIGHAAEIENLLALGKSAVIHGIDPLPAGVAHGRKGRVFVECTGGRRQNNKNDYR